MRKIDTEEQKADILSFKTSIYQPPTQKTWFSEEKLWAPGLPFVTITVKNWRGLTCPGRDGIGLRSLEHVNQQQLVPLPHSFYPEMPQGKMFL